MTRGEALLAMECGARVRQVWEHPCLQLVFFIKDDNLMSTDVFANSIEDAFLGCLSYELVPEPDTAEKFVRDMAERLKRDPKEKSLFWLCKKATPDTLDYTWRQRFDALLAQMDGEK